MCDKSPSAQGQFWTKLLLSLLQFQCSIIPAVMKDYECSINGKVNETDTLLVVVLG